MVQNKLGRNKLIVVSKPSKVEAKQTISVKEFTIIGAIGGFVVVVGISLILYLIAQIKKTKKTLV